MYICIIYKGVDGLLPDYAIRNLVESGELPNEAGTGTELEQLKECTGCKGGESPAVGRCYDCSNYLCSNCVMAHQFMHCFEGHRVVALSSLEVLFIITWLQINSN